MRPQHCPGDCRSGAMGGNKESVAAWPLSVSDVYLPEARSTCGITQSRPMSPWRTGSVFKRAVALLPSQALFRQGGSERVRSHHLIDRMYSTRALASASDTCGCGGMGNFPQTPVPPVWIFLASTLAALLSPSYLAATSFRDGPNRF